MKINKNWQGLQYAMQKIDSKNFEFDLLNASDCAICLNGFRIGKYDFMENRFFPTNLWENLNLTENENFNTTFFELTQRQQNLVLLYANKYFKKMYQDIYNAKLKAGKFFAPTQETIQNELYYINRIKKANENIKIYGGK